MPLRRPASRGQLGPRAFATPHRPLLPVLQPARDSGGALLWLGLSSKRTPFPSDISLAPAGPLPQMAACLEILLRRLLEGPVPPPAERRRPAPSSARWRRSNFGMFYCSYVTNYAYHVTIFFRDSQIAFALRVASTVSSAVSGADGWDPSVPRRSICDQIEAGGCT